MHEWAAVNSWSRPVANPGNGRFSVNIPVTPATGNGRYSVNIPLKSSITPQFGFRRCKTTLLGPSTVYDKHQVFKPRQPLRESSTLSFIRYLKVNNKESEAKLKNTMHVLSVQRSRSDLDVRDTPNSNVSMLGGGLHREGSHSFMTPAPEPVKHDSTSMIPTQRQEMKVGMAVVNRKGLIHLSTTGDSNPFPDMSAMKDSHKGHEQIAPTRQKSRSLIKRKDLMDHYKAGFKILEDEEIQRHQEEEMEKSLGDYTIMDLQSKLLEFTDAKSGRRGPGSASPESPVMKRNSEKIKQEKTITLPAIKNFNPFTMKS